MMKRRIEQDHEQYPLYTLTPPQATKAGVKVRSHPVGCMDIDALIRMGLLKEHERQDAEALQTAVTGLLYRAEEDLA